MFDCTVYIIIVTVYISWSVCVISHVEYAVYITSSESLYISWSVCVIIHADCTEYVNIVTVCNVVFVSVISHVHCTVNIITVTVYNVVSVRLSSVMLTVQCTSSKSLYVV